MSTQSADSRENSPNAADGSEKRASKKRKVLSCYACRNRKMKCDRIFPVCGRCQKTGRADQCTYDPRLLDEGLPNVNSHHAEGDPHLVQQPDQSESAAVSATKDALQRKLRIQERRLEIVEKRLAALDSDKHHSFDPPSSRFHSFEPNEPQIHEDIIFKGKGFKTLFCGSTSPLSSLNQFTELQAFTREAIASDENMHRVRHEFKASRDRKKIVMKHRSLKLYGLDDEIFALLPPKSVVDQHVSLYFQTWETSYRILHEPTFWREYQVFWDRKSNEDITATFPVTLVYIIAITKCAKPNDENTFVGDTSADREDALNLVNTCDVWLARLSRKRLTLPFFQLQCLSLLAKRSNCLQLKQDWVNAGEVIRLAIASGMHRNPALLSGGRISEYEKEMRRRVWVTIAELELQASIDCGLQSALCGLYFDIQPPANLPDDAVFPEMQQMPAGRPLENFTPASYLVMSLKSLPLRAHLMQILNNPTTDLQYADVLHYDTQISSMLSLRPAWEDPRATMASALLDFQLRQFLLILHRPYAKLAATNQRYCYSFTVCVDASSVILSSYEDLVAKGMLSLNHIRNDVLRVGTTLAQTVYYNCTLVPPSDMPHALSMPANSIRTMESTSKQKPFSGETGVKVAHLPRNNPFATTLCKTAIDLLEKARQLFEQKLLRLGTGYVEYWLLCAALGIMPSINQPATSIASITNTTSEDLRSSARRSLERLISVFLRIFALQKDPESGIATSLKNTMNTVALPIPSSVASLSGGSVETPTVDLGDNALPTSIDGPASMPATVAEGGGFGDFDDLQDMQFDLSGWTFPDFWALDMDGGF